MAEQRPGNPKKLLKSGELQEHRHAGMRRLKGEAGEVDRVRWSRDQKVMLNL